MYRLAGMLDASAGGCLRHMRCTKGDIYTSFSSTHQRWLRRRYQNDLKRIHRPCDLQGANKTCIQNLSLKILPNKKNINSQKSSPPKISHLEFGLQKFFDSLFLGLPIPSPFHVEHSPVNSHCSTANLRRFRLHP